MLLCLSTYETGHYGNLQGKVSKVQATAVTAINLWEGAGQRRRGPYLSSLKPLQTEQIDVLSDI